MVYASIGIFCILLSTTICGMKRPREPEQHDLSLEKVFRQQLDIYRQPLGIIPEGLDPDKHGEVVQWKSSTRIAVTNWGGIYSFANDKWTQMRQGEYASPIEFLNSIYAENVSNADATDRVNVNFHIKRNMFPYFVYHKKTETLMYLVHACPEWRRTSCMASSTKIAGHFFPQFHCYYPTKLAFENRGRVASVYDTQLDPENDQISSISCSHDGCYYAVYSKRFDNGLQRHVIKVVKRLENGTFGDDPGDVLTQGNDAKTKAFIFNIVKHKTQDDPRKMYFTDNNHLNFGMTVETGASYHYVISPWYGARRYSRVVDCGKNHCESLGAICHLGVLHKKLCNSKPTLYTSDSRMPVLVEALATHGLPKELRQRILYDLSYVDPALQRNSVFIYGADEEVLPEKEKKALTVLHDFKKYIDKNKNFDVSPYETWYKKKRYLFEVLLNDGIYDEDALWNAAKYGILWGDNEWLYGDTTCSRQLLKKRFITLELPLFKRFDNLIKGEIIIDPEGKLSINYPIDVDNRRHRFCSYVRDSFYREYIAQKDTADWGTKSHAQQFVIDHSVKEVSYADEALCFTLNNGTKLSVVKGDERLFGGRWETSCPRINSGSTRYWKSPYDIRTQEEAEEQWALM